MAEDSSKKRKLILDLDEVVRHTDDNSSIIEVERDNRSSDDRSQRRPTAMESEYPEHYSLKEECSRMGDWKLEETIQRQKKLHANVGKNLPDGGRKIEAAIKIMENEREKRKTQRPRMDADKAKQPAQLANPGLNGTPVGLSKFASSFRKKMEDDDERSDRKPFDKDLSAMGRGLKVKSSDDPSHKARQRNGPSTQPTFQSSEKSSFRSSVDNRGSKNMDITPGNFYSRGERIAKKNSNGLFRRIQNIEVPSSHSLRPRKEERVYLSDDDDEVMETVSDGKFDECMNNDIIVYPSRGDQDSVQVQYTDMKCLAPKSMVTSKVMNFYIRYLELQVMPTKKANSHIFSTFFYSKLKRELSDKGSEKESVFVKCRKWWKGINLFEKAYVLIPIHEESHWSLAIICFPEKDDKSDLILLHLDSLELHSSRDIFDVIKSCLREEWKCLHKDIAPSNLQMSENRILTRLPDIYSKSVKVPQQGNDYDCGIFVLYFMQRFIEDAPERLKRQDLHLFSRHWFHREEACRLRRKIRDILMTEFRNARKESHSSN